MESKTSVEKGKKIAINNQFDALDEGNKDEGIKTEEEKEKRQMRLIKLILKVRKGRKTNKNKDKERQNYNKKSEKKLFS